MQSITYTGATGTKHTVPFRPVYGASEDLDEEVDEDLDLDLLDDEEPEPDPEPRRQRQREVQPKKGRPNAALAAMRKQNTELQRRLEALEGAQPKPEPRPAAAARPAAKPAAAQPQPKPAVASLEPKPANQDAIRAEIQREREDRAFRASAKGFIERHPEFAGKDAEGKSTGKWDPKWLKTLDPLVNSLMRAGQGTGPDNTLSIEDIERLARTNDEAFAILNTKNARGREAKVIAATHGSGPQGSRNTRGQGSPQTADDAADIVRAHYASGDKYAGNQVKADFRKAHPDKYADLLKNLYSQTE